MGGVRPPGGVCVDPCNLISGNRNEGLYISGGTNVVQGNFVGTDLDGTSKLGNNQGIELFTDGNTIGGAKPGEGNVISGNKSSGIRLQRSDSNIIQGNLIGTDITRTKNLGNGRNGVRLVGSSDDNKIGGLAPGAGNVIAFNQNSGVEVVEGERNRILSNSIFSNGIFGILPFTRKSAEAIVELTRPTVQLPKDGQPGKTRIPWVQSTRRSNKAFILQFFSNIEFIGAQGAELIGTVEFTSNPDQWDHNGVAVFPFAVSDDVITATATSEDKNTSYFSPASIVVEDSDGDGISDLREDRGPNNGDADNNKVKDKDESNVATTEANGNGINIETTAQTMAMAIFLAAAGTDKDVVFSAGLLDLLLEGLKEENPTALGLAPLAESTTVTLRLPPDLQVDSYYNFGPTPDNPDPHFYEFLFDGTTGAEILADRIVVHFVDGQRGDHDLTENGEIATRGGPVTNATPLYFPFSEIAPGTFTGFAVSNFSNRNAVVEFDAFDSGGELSLFANNPAIFGISESNQLAQLGSEIFDSTSESVSWVKLKSDNPQIASFFQFGKLDLSQLDGSVAISRTSKEFYFTRVFEGAAAYRDQPATTFLSIANPGTEEIELELTLHPSADEMSPAGGPATITRTLPAKGFLHESVEDLFGPGVEVSGGWVEGKVTRGGGVVGFELIQLKNQSTVIGLNAVAETGGSESFSAQLATQPGVLFTNVNLINTSDEPRSLTLTAFAEDGTQLAQPAFRMLNPGGQLSEDAASLFVSQPGTGLQGTATDFVGSLQVEADGPGVIGDGIFGDPTSFQFAAALPLQTKSFLEAVFSQVANIPGFFTGLAFFAPEEDADITIEVRAADGTLVGQSQQFLTAGHRLSKLVPELVPDSDGQAGGYIVIRSTAPLIAQQLFGALGPEGIRLLSAVPPTVVAEPDLNLLSAGPSTVVQ